MSEDRAREAVEHLQTAALEVIAALRAVLDVAEDLVRDPAQAAGVASTFAEQAARAAGGSGGDGGARPGRKRGAGDQDEPAGVRRIPLS